MANKKMQSDMDAANNLRSTTSLSTYGMDSSLDDENSEIKNIVKNVIADTKDKLGERTNDMPINYFNELNFGEAYSVLTSSTKKNANGVTEKTKSLDDLKKYMSDNSQVDMSGLIAEDSERLVAFNNYRIIQKHIPECAQALNIYKDNIMSPDDFTKIIFNVEYDGAIDADSKKEIDRRLDKLKKKYNLEKKVDTIIEQALLLGETEVAVLSLNDDMALMLNDPVMTNNKTLNEETIRSLDKDLVSSKILSENIEMDKDTTEALSECFGYNPEDPDKKDNLLTEDAAKELVANMVNNNVVIGSSSEMLLERYEADEAYDKTGGTGVDIPGAFSKPSKKNGKKSDSKKIDSEKGLYLNGSAIRMLIPDRIVELTIDDVCYGYYYAEEAINSSNQSSYLGVSNGRDIRGGVSLAQNSTISSSTSSTYNPSSGPASQLNIGEKKLHFISDMFLNQISKKIDKEFIRKNKKFKDFIYQLVKQDFIIKKGLKLTYFKPDEVIKFECQPVYRNIVFFAKMYLSILTNNLLIKLGRAHDKRIFYVNVGADAKYEEAIQGVIKDIKTKDYKMESLNDFNTLLNLSPGRFDDYFMPTMNGERPIEIDTLAGMDVDMNNDFVEYLKNSMLSGMEVPTNLIDVNSQVDFARTISSTNANLVRSVIKYQKVLTPPFTAMYQKLYKNEYRFDEGGNTDSIKDVDVNQISVKFPSPASLNMTNISQQITAADQNADFIASQIVPIKADGSTEDKRIRMKSKVVRDLLPGIDWDKYEDMEKDLDRELEKDKAKDSDKQPDTGMSDPNMINGNSGMY